VGGATPGGAAPGSASEALLTLASSERGLREREPVDLAEVTRAIVAAREEEAARRDLRMDVHLGPAATAGDPGLVERLVANLVDNAILHNVGGGHVRVTTAMAAGTACLSVVNTGPVVPPEEVGRLFEPFQQLDGERTRRGGGHKLGHGPGPGPEHGHGHGPGPEHEHGHGHGLGLGLGLGLADRLLD
jgi:signal transduction histidine kinase